MLPWSEIPAALTSLGQERFVGELHRCLELGALISRLRKSPDFKFLYAATVESRFTFDGGPRRLYVSAEKPTAEAELLHYFEGSGSPNTANLVIDCSIFSVLDLTDPAIERHLGTSRGELDLEWQVPLRHPRSVTQQLGTAVFKSGRFNAIRFWSARAPSGKNLVVFPDRLAAGADQVTFLLRDSSGTTILEETLKRGNDGRIV